MAEIIGFPVHTHARASSSIGYRSGRSSCRGTRDARSTANTRSGGTSSHCEIACGVIPSEPAKAPNPPASLIARRSASVLSFMAKDESIAFQENQALLHCANQAALYAIGMTLGNRIKSARKKIGLTQKEVGQYFGISGQAVSQWERDTVAPEIDKLGKLSRVLKIPAEWLLSGDGPPPEQDEVSRLLDRLDPTSRRQALRILRSLVEDNGQAA